MEFVIFFEEKERTFAQMKNVTIEKTQSIVTKIATF